MNLEYLRHSRYLERVWSSEDLGNYKYLGVTKTLTIFKIMELNESPGGQYRDELYFRPIEKPAEDTEQ